VRRLVVAGLGLALLGSGCAPDPLDTYGAPDAAPATLPPLPTTTAPTDSEDQTPAPTFPANGSTVEVRALDNSFVAATVEIEAGTEIKWINGGRNDHDVLPVDETLDWGVEREEFVPTAEYSHRFGQPGVYPYYCSIHGTKEAGMVGAIVVTEPT
jgi:plastocyanin